MRESGREGWEKEEEGVRGGKEERQHGGEGQDTGEGKQLK